MAILWEADGEDAGGDPYEFDSLVETSGNDLEKRTDAARSGIYGYRTLFAGVSEVCYGLKAIGNQIVVFLQLCFKIPVWNYNNNENAIWPFFYDGGSWLVYLNMIYHTASEAFGYELRVLTNGPAYTVITKLAEDIFEKGQWYCIELGYKIGVQGVGGWAFWIDGISEGSDFTSYATDNYLINGIRIGQGGGVVPQNGDMIYWDDVIAANTRPAPPGGLVKVAAGGIIKPKWFGWRK